MQKERWKRLKEEKGYLISTWGRIFSIKNSIILRPNIHQSRSNKYLRVELNGKKYMVHLLVGMNFKRKEYLELQRKFPYCKIQGDHKDRNTLNPNLSNFRWVTESENKTHMHETSVIIFAGKTYRGKLDAKLFSNNK